MNFLKLLLMPDAKPLELYSIALEFMREENNIKSILISMMQRGVSQTERSIQEKLGSINEEIEQLTQLVEGLEQLYISNLTPSEFEEKFKSLKTSKADLLVPKIKHGIVNANPLKVLIIEKVIEMHTKKKRSWQSWLKL